MGRGRGFAGWRLAASVFVFAAAMLGAAAAANAETLDQLKPHDYVNDFAGVLTPQATESLNMLCGQIDHRANAQIAVITVHTIGDEDIDDFVSKLEERWGVGTKGGSRNGASGDRGVLIFLAVDDHKYRIEVGYGLEGILPDGRVGEIGRLMIPYLRQRDYSGAVTAATEAIAQIIASDANVTLDPRWNLRPASSAQQQQISPKQAILGLLFLLLFLFFIARAGGGGMLGFILGMLLGGGGRGGGFGDGGGFGGGGGDGFGGFGGGGSGGGGASGSW